jgi:hypothetical protein
VNAVACRTWCAEDSCDPGRDTHVSERRLAHVGGPIEQMPTPPAGAADLTASVCVEQTGADMARVIMRASLLVGTGHHWEVPGPLLGLLPQVEMTATRARYLARLLVESADLADQINDGPVELRLECAVCDIPAAECTASKDAGRAGCCPDCNHAPLTVDGDQ